MLSLTEDKLKREKFLDDLFCMFENFGNQNGHGFTLVINGKYGSGKSTLLGFIEERNTINDKFKIVKYDAWENNFAENPMFPILYSISKLEKTGNKIKDTAKSVIKNIQRAIISTLSGAYAIDLQALFSNENFFDEYDAYKSAIEKFKNVLTSYCNKKKTILLVDELDRCLPEYQVKVLESVYHLLDIPNLIVLIALDKDQLENAIKTKFGKELNCHGYLAKFIQYEIDLPEGDTYQYILSLMKFQTDYNPIYRKLAELFRSIKLPLRECILIIEKLNLLYNDGQIWEYYYPIMTAVLLLLKQIDNKVYQMFFSQKRENVPDNVELIELQDTAFAKFSDQIKGSEFEKIIQFWLSDNGNGLSLLLHFINLFYPIGKISPDSLSNYCKSTPSDIIAWQQNDESWVYPHTANRIIDNVNLLV